MYLNEQQKKQSELNKLKDKNEKIQVNNLHPTIWIL